MKATLMILAGAIVIALIFFFALLGAAVGAIAGFIVGLTPMGGMIVQTFEAWGFPGINVMNLGATLGFISAFFISTTHRGDDK